MEKKNAAHWQPQKRKRDFATKFMVNFCRAVTLLGFEACRHARSIAMAAGGGVGTVGVVKARHILKPDYTAICAVFIPFGVWSHRQTAEASNMFSHKLNFLSGCKTFDAMAGIVAFQPTAARKCALKQP